ncbi:glycoside hydrolase family 2 protein [Hymenobacter sp. RP-2-7]|uniref:Glycoside hydrolase family 2 protein n=1 Tax=Hymenobacter polaris TaxID=2682546 RepID=A0A7Y0FLQ9_9BACT|nr:beta-galactosidase GalB [Hymenobacter polaris]NML64681.1 glycoside hydrolase family 2 protein [Hymenobacter polaris]
MTRLAALLPVAATGWLLTFATTGKQPAGSRPFPLALPPTAAVAAPQAERGPRERISLNEGWRFYRYGPAATPDSLIYDVRPEVRNEQDSKAADSRPTEAVAVAATQTVLKPWILPTGNDFIRDPARRHARPAGNPGGHFPFVQAGFDDTQWERVTLPHDWASKGPFYAGEGVPIGGGMGRLPVQGVAWYRRKLAVPATDAGRTFYLDVEGAMSYAMVWLNGQLVGGWPYGYSSWRLDLTPYIKPGQENQLAIRLDNPPASARWYPGAGLYRNVWLTKVNPVHVGQWGTTVTTPRVSKTAATVSLRVAVANKGASDQRVDVATEIYQLSAQGEKTGRPVARLPLATATVRAQATDTVAGVVTIANPRLWGPPPTQTPNRYVAVTTLLAQGKALDVYETPFGIREVRFEPDKGLFVNGEHILVKGANQHHDLGPLGAAFNERAAERQLQLLRAMGCNAVRMSHNPPAPELLALTDRLGFLVLDEIFDCWELKKTPLDFHLIFPDWHEPDLRALIRRDRNSPSVVLWSFGNEVGEQYTGEKGAAVARELYAIAKQEDPTRPTTVAMNYAKPDMPLPAVADVISLNYQGEGIRNGGAYAGLKGISTPPLFPAFHQKFPGKMILSSENASALSSRGEFLFPVYPGNSAPVADGQGGNSTTHQVSAYELYSVDFGASADKVFATLDQHPYVAGGFVWTGWDYLGEPTPYYSSRSSYSGIIDLAGFPKERFYLYQSYWRPELPMAHLLPHWNWPQRRGQPTPVHVFTSGDEAELFLNGKTLGRKKKAAGEYRLRWDDVVYAPGELRVVAYKHGRRWAEDRVRTTGEPRQVTLAADRHTLQATGEDLVFITAQLTDKDGRPVPTAANKVAFSVEGPGELVATGNGDAANLVSFASPAREAFNGKCLVIVRARKGAAGTIMVRAQSGGLAGGSVSVQVR